MQLNKAAQSGRQNRCAVFGAVGLKRHVEKFD